MAVGLAKIKPMQANASGHKWGAILREETISGHIELSFELELNISAETDAEKKQARYIGILCSRGLNGPAQNTIMEKLH